MAEKSLKFAVREHDSFTVVEVKIVREGGIAVPADVRAVGKAPRVEPQRGVVLSGRLPIWLHAALVHQYHPTAWVAVYDPRLGGAVVVESHRPARKLGEVVEVSEDE